MNGRFCFRVIGFRAGIRRRSKLFGGKLFDEQRFLFRIYDLRSTSATRLSAGGVADEWVTQMLRQGDAQAFKKYSQMKLQVKREALEKLNRRANEITPAAADVLMEPPMCTAALQ